MTTQFLKISGLDLDFDGSRFEGKHFEVIDDFTNFSHFRPEPAGGSRRAPAGAWRLRASANGRLQALGACGWRRLGGRLAP